MSPYCFLPNCRRLRDLALCYSLIHVPGDPTQGAKNTVCRFPPCRSRRFRTWTTIGCSVFAACKLLTLHTQSAAASKRNIPFTAPPPRSRKEHDTSTRMGNTLAASGVFITKLEPGHADEGSVQGTSLTSRMFRDPGSLKEGLQRKFICKLNT